MLRLKLVKNAEAEGVGNGSQEDNSGLIHGCVVLKELVQPWFNSNRTVCADSYFASVSTALELGKLGLRFIGVIKTATKKFPQSYLSSIEAPSGQARGWWKGVVHKVNGIDTLYAFVWVDRDRRYFITNTSSLCHGRPYTRERQRQIQPVESQEPPERVQLTINQPMAAELYYDTCGKIDQHNKRRHDTLRLEKKIETNDWSKRVNLSIFAMTVVDSFLLYNQLVDDKESEMVFYAKLAEELIDNQYDRVVRRKRPSGDGFGSPSSIIGADGLPRAGINTHLTPTKRKRMARGAITKQYYQGKCKVCKKKSKFTCSQCKDNGLPDIFLCHSDTGRACFSQHVESTHMFN